MPDQVLARARDAAAVMRAMPVRARLAVIRRFRRALAADPLALAATLGDRRPVAETLTAEILPLAEAARFLERRAAALLAPRPLREGRPAWLWGVQAEIRREPCGCILVLGPGNFPLFLPGAQVLQALAAGNAVVAKPAEGGAAALAALALLLERAGLPADALQVLDASAATGAAAAAAGFDRIVLTGSAETGRRVLQAAAANLTPCTMELSGCDAAFVLDGADLALVADCLAYGLRLNGGATCIAPRRVFLPERFALRLEQELRLRIAGLPPVPVPAATLHRLRPLLQEAGMAGARISAWPGPTATPPILVTGAMPGLRLLQEDVFAPVISLIPVADTEAALAAAAQCPYALGASVFGPVLAARALAARIDAGSVVINDLIVPTADPRLPFGGRHRSGFGVTRGAEGLLEMTVVKTVSVRRGRFRPHLAPPRPADAGRMAALIGLLHGAIGTRLAALLRFRGG
jgi:acyl-CoA reductase-like NAD-dependent aldehyde dehydrogenase